MGDAAQVWREGGPGQNSGNRAGLIKQIQDRCGGKNQAGEEKQEGGKRKQYKPQNLKKHINRHTWRLK